MKDLTIQFGHKSLIFYLSDMIPAPMGRPQDFSRGGQIRGSGDGSLQEDTEAEPRWGLMAKPPEAGDMFRKLCTNKYVVY